MRRELNRVLLVLLSIGTLGALACSGGDDDAAAGAQATPATPAPTSTPETAPTQAPSVGPTDTSRDLTGFPFSTADLRQAIETAGYSFAPLTNIAPICPQTSVPEQAFWSVNLTDGDSGPILVLWVYPNSETLKADWQAEPGQAPQSLPVQMRPAERVCLLERELNNGIRGLVQPWHRIGDRPR